MRSLLEHAFKTRQQLLQQKQEKWESTQLFRVGLFMFVGPGSKDIWHNNQHGRHELEGLLDSRLRK